MMRSLGLISCLFTTALTACAADAGTLDKSPAAAAQEPTAPPDVASPPATDTNQTVAPVAPNPNTPPAVASACDNSNLRLCDDFEAQAEGASPDPNLWNVEKSTSSFAPEPVSGTLRPPGNTNQIVEVTKAEAKRGKQSLHFHANNVGLEHVVISNTSFFPVANNTFYGRVFILYPSSNPLPVHHTSLVEADGPTPATVKSSEGGDLVYTRFGIDFTGELEYNWLGNDANVHSTMTLPVGIWTCFEFEFKGDTNELHAWMNEQPLTALDVKNGQPAWAMPKYARLQLGWENYQTDAAKTQAWDIYYDGVAFDTQRIGCTK